VSRKRIIRKIIIVAAWLVVGSGLLTLLIAANSSQHTRKCKQLVISITGADKIYIEKTDIKKLLATKLKGSIINKPLTDFNLSGLEKVLKTHAWIKNAELFFDNQDVLHVLVTEKEPVVRVFTKNGATFYLDSAGKKMPLLQNTNIRLAVVTNFPDYKNASAKDSALVNGLKDLIAFINANEFWKAQIAQVDVTEDYHFELIPTVGNHIIRFGSGENVEDKFKRLYVFYQQVLSKTGFDKYRIVDVQYADQIVGVKKEAVAQVDSIQLQKNIELLMNETHVQEADQQQPEVLNTPVNGYGPQGVQTTVTDTTLSNPNPPKKDQSPLKTTPSVPVQKPIAQPVAKPKPAAVIQKPASQVIKSNPKKGTTKPKPKAVMKKQNEY
jgi:cell division protein FtsQ